MDANTEATDLISSANDFFTGLCNLTFGFPLYKYGIRTKTWERFAAAQDNLYRWVYQNNKIGSAQNQRLDIKAWTMLSLMVVSCKKKYALLVTDTSKLRITDKYSYFLTNYITYFVYVCFPPLNLASKKSEVMHEIWVSVCENARNVWELASLLLRIFVFREINGSHVDRVMHSSWFDPQRSREIRDAVSWRDEKPWRHIIYRQSDRTKWRASYSDKLSVKKKRFWIWWTLYVNKWFAVCSHWYGKSRLFKIFQLYFRYSNRQFLVISFWITIAKRKLKENTIKRIVKVEH